MEVKTKDGFTLLSGQSVRMFNSDGCLISGSIHHYGGDGWQLSLHGPYVHDLYLDQLNALVGKRDRLIEQLADTQARIKKLC
jgi:hypothetical protein